MHDRIVPTPILHIKKLSCNNNDYITICISSNNYIEMNNLQWLSTNACMCIAYTYECYDYVEFGNYMHGHFNYGSDPVAD